MFEELLEEKNLTKADISKRAGIPYTTVLDFISGRRNIRHCGIEMFVKLATVFDMSADELYSYVKYKQMTIKDIDFFKSNIHHRLKDLGQINFLIETLENNQVEYYYQRYNYIFSFYTLALVDYLSRCNDIPLYKKYDYIRKQKLKDVLYPSQCYILNDFKVDRSKLIPEFLAYNIIEGSDFYGS